MRKKQNNGIFERTLIFLGIRKDNKSAQETLPYRSIFRNGICMLDKNIYNKTVEFDDISYQLADIDTKQGMFHSYCAFLNFFHEDIFVQFTFLNQKVDQAVIDRQITLPSRHDTLSGMCDEYQGYLKRQNLKGSNGLVKYKFVTFGVHSNDRVEAEKRLERLEMSVMENFNRLGCKSKVLNGYSRINLLFRCLNRNRKFTFSWEKLKSSGKRTHDFIAPMGFDFSIMNSFKIGQQVASSACVEFITEELDDKFLSELLELNQGMLVSIHIKAFNQIKAQKLVRQKLTSKQAQAINHKKDSHSKGLVDAPLPPELQQEIDHLEELYSKITDQNQRLFDVTMVITNISDNLEELNLETAATKDIVQAANCQLRALSWRQEEGFLASLPLGVQSIEKKDRTLSTYSLAIMMPFITKNLFQLNDPEVLYYGLNQLNNNMIMANRKKLRTPNGLILGTPGSGKSFSAKREIINVLLATNDDVILLDPEGEYLDFTNHVNGTIINISAVSTEYINPLEITVNLEDDNPIVLKTDFILSFCELVMKRTLTAGEQSIIGRCIKIIYAAYMEDQRPENMPVLENLYDELKLVDDPGDDGLSRELSAELALGLEQYVKGQMKVFNNRTNVDLDNRVVTFNIKEMGETMRPLGMLIVQEFVWQRVRKNRDAGKTTWYDCDECHLLLQHDQTARYSIEIYKRFRKWGGIPTFMTQNVKDFLRSMQIENIIDNSDFIMLLNQGTSDLGILSRKRNISPELAERVKDVPPGQGIIIYNDIQLAFVDKFPKNTSIYRVLTTVPEEIQRFKEQDAAAREKEASQAMLEVYDNSVFDNGEEYADEYEDIDYMA